MANGECGELCASTVEEWIAAADHKRGCAQLAQGCKDRIELLFRARMYDVELQSEAASRGKDVSRYISGIGIGRVDE